MVSGLILRPTYLRMASKRKLVPRPAPSTEQHQRRVQYRMVALERYGAVANEVDGGYSHDLMCLWRAAMLRNILAGL